MKHHPSLILGPLTVGCAAFLSGCTNLPNIRASEFHRTTSYPLFFTHQVDATGVEKVTLEDGRIIRRAKSLTSTITAGGYSSSTVLKDAELETIEEDKAPAPVAK